MVLITGVGGGSTVIGCWEDDCRMDGQRDWVLERRRDLAEDAGPCRVMQTSPAICHQRTGSARRCRATKAPMPHRFFPRYSPRSTIPQVKHTSLLSPPQASLLSSRPSPGTPLQRLFLFPPLHTVLKKKEEGKIWGKPGTM